MNAIKIKYSGLPIVVITAGEPLFFRTDSFCNKSFEHECQEVSGYYIYHLSIDCSGMVLEFVEEEDGISRNKPKFR